jgi:integrase
VLANVDWRATGRGRLTDGGKRAERTNIGLREVRKLGPNETIWDSEVRGFGARRRQTKAVYYFVRYRTHDGRQRVLAIGKHGSPWTPDEARGQARDFLYEARKGGDPAVAQRAKRKAATVAELCDLYLEDAEAGRLITRRRTPKKSSTLTTDRGRIERHIKPLLGQHKVAAVTDTDIKTFMHDVASGKTAGRTKTAKKRGLAFVRGGKGTATRTIGLLGAIFTYAVEHKMRQDNPVKGIQRYADGQRERRLLYDPDNIKRDNEYAMLGAALRKAKQEDIWPAAVAVVRFLAFTGWRSGEALGLRWKDIDVVRHVASLPDTKTGRSLRVLSRLGEEILVDLKKTSTGDDDALVFAATRGDGPMMGFRKLWDRIAKLGGLPGDITPHVLRHSFASLAGDLGYSELTIAALVGHSKKTVTSKYVHSTVSVLLSAANATANRTAELMGEQPTSPQKEIPEVPG